MSTADIILVSILLAPVIVLSLLRVNAALVFLSMCLGDVLVQFVAGDTNTFIAFFGSPQSVQSFLHTGSTTRLVLLLLPVVLTTIFMIRTVKGIKLVINVLPAIGVGVLGLLLVIPLLSSSQTTTLLQSSLWKQIVRSQDLLVGASALICLANLWLQRPKSYKEDKHGKHHGKND